MLTSLHFLLTCACNYECDHCFVYSGPSAGGTFTLDQIRQVLREATRIGSVEWIYFEGGEPTLYYPLMLEGLRLARGLGFRTGIVTNVYWATTDEDAELWLRPLVDAGLADLSVSDDEFHFGRVSETPAKRALRAAARLGLAAGPICIEQPTLQTGVDKEQQRGAPVIRGGAMFRGRAAEKLVAGLPRRPWQEFNECPYEDLADPGRVHLDAYGNVHLCQGLCLGNLWQTPLAELVASYTPPSHPIAGPLLRGGPAGLAHELGLPCEDAYVDACHLCYSLRRALLDAFPQYLAPRQVYGLNP